MAGTKEAAARVDDKGRVTLPKDMREALGVGAGDTVFFRYDPQNNQLRIAPAKSPFDVLAEHALREHEEGRTKTIEEYAEGRAARRAKALKGI
jgi:AbrB family looped-hinge helix DNA binding protein